MSSYRRSGGAAEYAHDDSNEGSNYTQRWDRDRFERMSGRSRAPQGNRESFQFEEDDNYYRGGQDRNIRVEYYDDDRYSIPHRPRPEYLDDDGYRSTGREMAAYRRDYDHNYNSSPRYTGHSRRQSSLDRYDDPPPRRPYEDERDINVNVHVSPTRRPYPGYEDRRPRYDYHDDEEYRDSTRRETERTTYRRYDDHNDHRENNEPYRKKGKTRMPKRLVHRNALLQKGYPFDETEDFFVLKLALKEWEINEVVKISESYFSETTTSSSSHNTEVKIDESRMLKNDPEPEQQPETTEVVETVTTKVIENPTEEDLQKYSQLGQGADTENDGDDGNDEHHNNSSKSSHARSSHHDSSHNHSGTSASKKSSHHSKDQSQKQSTYLSVKNSSHHSRSASASHQSRSKGASQAGRSASSHHSKSRRNRSGSSSSSSTETEKQSKHISKSTAESITSPTPSKSPARGRSGTARFEDSSSTTIAVPEGRKEKDINAEIQALEAERRALKKERDDWDKEERSRGETEYEIVARTRDRSKERNDRDVVRVEKDSRGRLSLVRSAQ